MYRHSHGALIVLSARGVRRPVITFDHLYFHSVEDISILQLTKLLPIIVWLPFFDSLGIAVKALNIWWSIQSLGETTDLTG
jgi:hypothetical protein